MWTRRKEGQKIDNFCGRHTPFRRPLFQKMRRDEQFLVAQFLLISRMCTLDMYLVSLCLHTMERKTIMMGRLVGGVGGVL